MLQATKDFIYDAWFYLMILVMAVLGLLLSLAALAVPVLTLCGIMLAICSPAILIVWLIAG